MRKQQATDAEVKAFMEAVYPDAASLAMASFGERDVLTTATKLIADLRADNKGRRLESNIQRQRNSELDEAHKRTLGHLQSAQRALGNCYMTAKREKHRLNRTGRVEVIHGLDTTSVERWGHVMRFCEEAGCKSDILRATLPTELTDGGVESDYCDDCRSYHKGACGERP